jgi:hypothetical protein
VRGGIVVMLLFVWIIVEAFSRLGVAMRFRRSVSRRSQLLAWAIAAALFANVISLMSVSYFDQNIVNWYLVLAMAAVISNQPPAQAGNRVHGARGLAEVPEVTTAG